MSTRKNKKRIAAAVLAAFLVLTAAVMIMNREYTVTRYSADGGGTGLCAVFLTDVHGRELGENNEKLVTEVKDAAPDVILMAGDLIDFDGSGAETALSLIGKLSDIAPVFCSMGNHEREYDESTGGDAAGMYRSAGAAVLDEEYTDIEIGGRPVRIGGTYGYCLPEKYDRTEEETAELKFLRDFEDTESYKILLSHLPYGWVDYGFCKDYDIDLVLCGHVHGGQARLPLIGGMYDPEFGWFPGKREGIFRDGGTTAILSRGIGGKFPRINNPAEIVIINVTK